MSYRVEVVDQLSPAAGREGLRYVSPPQTLAEARALVHLLVDGAAGGADGPWQYPIPWGRRHVRLLRDERSQQ